MSVINMSRLTLITALCLGCMTALSYGEQIEAKCTLEASSGDTSKPIVGTITLTQASSTAATKIDIDISGFEAMEVGKKHGFHIHTTGDVGGKCVNAGGHYNPMSKEHGAPTDTNRHVGDLGNVVVQAGGEVIEIRTDTMVKLSGTTSVLDRAIVVHAGEDDLGTGGEMDSKTTGHAGARWACCKIVKTGTSSASHVVLSSSLTILLLSLYTLL